VRAEPGIRDRQAEVLCAQPVRPAVRQDDQPAEDRLKTAVRQADAPQHQIPAIVKVQAEPVPALGILTQGAGAELMIHPRRALHFVRLAADGDRAARQQAREGVVVAGIARLVAFGAEAAVALQGRGLDLLQAQVDGHFPCARRDARARRPGIFRRHLPALQPDAVEGVCRRTGQPCPTPAEALMLVERLPGDVGHGEMRHVDLIGAPLGSGLCLRRGDGPPEDRELEAKARAGLSGQVAAVVPPLGLVVRMRAVIARELPVIRAAGPRVARRAEGYIQQVGPGADLPAADFRQAHAQQHDRQRRHPQQSNLPHTDLIPPAQARDLPASRMAATAGDASS